MQQAIQPTRDGRQNSVREIGECADDETFKSAMCKLAGGVVVLSAVNEAGQKFGLTMTAMISTSLSPPLVMASIDTRSRVLPHLQDQQLFSVNVLSSDQEDIAMHFAGSAADKFLGVEHDLSPEGLPAIKGASAVLHCRLDDTLVTGDHTVVVGRVVDAATDEEARPLVYYQRSFYRL